jgi:hypothetical protein
LLPILGIVRTFNLLVLAGGVLTAFAMYLYARARTGDPAASWIGGLLFGFSPFMTVRSTEHFSLVLAAPIPIFAWLLYKIWTKPSLGLSCAGAQPSPAVRRTTPCCLMMLASPRSTRCFLLNANRPRFDARWPAP